MHFIYDINRSKATKVDSTYLGYVHTEKGISGSGSGFDSGSGSGSDSDSG